MCCRLIPLGASNQLVEAFAHGDGNLLQVTVAQVEPQFFEGASDFNPGMSPSLYFKVAFLVAHVLDDIARVAQGKLKLVRRHFEDAAERTGKGGIRTREVRALSAGSQVADHIDTGHNAEARVKEDSRVEDGFVVFLSYRTMVAAELDKVALVSVFLDVVFELLQVVRVVKEAVLGIPLFEYASPRSPTIDIECGCKEVVVGDVGSNFVIVHTRNHADAGVILVAFQQLGTEGEETEGWDIVVLKEDATVYVFEGPFLREIFRWIATVVFFLIKAMHFAGPVDVFHHLAACFQFGNVCLVARSVLVKEEFGWLRLAYLIEYLTK